MQGRNMAALEWLIPDDDGEALMQAGNFPVVARACLEAKKVDAKAPNGKPSLLTLRLSRIGKEIYAATVAMGRVDATEERQTISEMDSDLGCTSAQTEELMRCLRDFGVEDDPKPTTTQAARRAA